MALRFNQHRGIGNPNAELTPEKVAAARDLYRLGYAFTKLAGVFGVSSNTVRDAVRGNTWSHLPGAVRV